MDERFLSNTMLFRGLREEEIRAMLSCLGASEKAFQKDEVLLRAGEPVSAMGLVLSGSVNIVVNYYWGGSNIFGHVGPGEIFAETYAAIPGKELLVDVVAAEPVRVLFLHSLRLTETCSRSCPFHTRTIHNLLQIFARKNLNLSARMMHTASRSIRGRLLSSCRSRRWNTAAAASPFPSPASSWRTTWGWSAALCPMSSPRCSGRG